MVYVIETIKNSHCDQREAISHKNCFEKNKIILKLKNLKYLIMKRIIMLAFLAVFSLLACKDNAVSRVKKENLESAKKRDANMKGAPIVKFDRLVHNFGTVDEGDVVETIFKVTNVGESNLIISKAKASCGCTVPTWPKGAIKPNETAEIGVKFNTSGKKNKQSKTITLTTNTEKGRETVTISGMVTPKK